MVRGVLIVPTCFSGRLLRTFWEFGKRFGCKTARILALAGPRRARSYFFPRGPEIPWRSAHPVRPPPATHPVRSPASASANDDVDDDSDDDDYD